MIWDRVVVIHDNNKPERLERFTQDWHSSKILSQTPFQIFSAITPKESIAPSWWRPRWADNDELARGHWCCFRSHLAVLERAYADGVKHLLVLEDDAFPRPSFDKHWETFFSNLPNSWLGYKLTSGDAVITSEVAPHVLQLRSHNRQGTQALGYNTNGMKVALDHIWKNFGSSVVDICLGFMYDQSNRWFRPQPWLFGERAGLSSTDLVRRSRTEVFDEEGYALNPVYLRNPS